MPGETIADGTFITGASWRRLYHDMRFVDGALPADGQESPTQPLLCGCATLRRPLDYPALAAVCDVFFPGSFSAGAARSGGTIH